jgi:hypothetical protein
MFFMLVRAYIGGCLEDIDHRPLDRRPSRVGLCKDPMIPHSTLISLQMEQVLAQEQVFGIDNKVHFDYNQNPRRSRWHRFCSHRPRCYWCHRKNSKKDMLGMAYSIPGQDNQYRWCRYGVCSHRRRCSWCHSTKWVGT